MNTRSIFDNVVFGSFLVLVGSLAIQKPSITSFAGQAVSATDVLFPIVFLLCLGSVLFGRLGLRYEPIYLWFAAYIVVFAVASLFSKDPHTSFLKTFSIAYLVGLAVLGIAFIDSMPKLRMAIAAWLIGAIVPVAIGLGTIVLFYISPTNSLLSELTHHYGSVPVGNFPRLSPTFVSASMFCNYLTATLMLLLAFVDFGRSSTPLWWFPIIAVVVCSLFTVSAGLGALVLCVSIWFCFSMNCSPVGRFVKYSGIGVCVVSLLVTLVALQPHSTSPYSYHLSLTGTEIFPSARLIVWGEAIRTFVSNFLTGIGPGMPAANVKFQNTDGHFSLLTDAHNSILSVAAQCGVFGALAMIGMTVQALKAGFGSRPISEIRFAIALAFLGGFVIQGLTSSFEDARHMWVLLGFVIASANIDKLDNAQLAV